MSTRAVVVGADGSTASASVFVASSLPEASVERYWSVWRPGWLSVSGPVYGWKSPSVPNRYSTVSTPVPDSPSSAASVTCGTLRYQPSSPSGAAGATVAVVVGAARSWQSTWNQSKCAAFAESSPLDTFRPTFRSVPSSVIGLPIGCQASPSIDHSGVTVPAPLLIARM